jgi:hypothetical protein
MRNPATTAVTSPAAGVAPEAIAIAMLSGKATIATVTPAAASATNCLALYPGRVVRIFGFTRSLPLGRWGKLSRPDRRPFEHGARH